MMGIHSNTLLWREKMKALIEKIKGLLSQKEKMRELILYVFFGVMTTAVNWVVYLMITGVLGLSSHPEGSASYLLISNIGQVTAWIISVLFAYATNKKFVFQSETGVHTGALREFWLFVSARIASLLIFDLLLFNGLLLLGLNDKWDKLLMNGLVVIFNYVASRFVVFRKGEKK